MKYKTVVFDVDSTIVTIEGLVEIAGQKGVTNQVANITHEGMNGVIPFKDSIKSRLDVIKPTKQDFEWLSDEYTKSLTIGARELIDTLQFNGVAVYLLSGSFAKALQKLAEVLHLPEERVYALDIDFDQNGMFKSIDLNQTILQDKGKSELLKHIAPERKLVVIGDGTTDLETAEYADAFIGFGGVVQREAVRKNADYYTDSPDLRDVLKWL